MKVIRETTLHIDFSELLPGMDNDVAAVCQGVNPFHVDCELYRDADGVIQCKPCDVDIADMGIPCDVYITDMVIDHIGRRCIGLFPHMFYIVKVLIAEETERAERGELFEDEY